MDMLSQGLGVYHMATQNTSIGKCPGDACSGTTAWRHFPAMDWDDKLKEATVRLHAQGDVLWIVQITAIFPGLGAKARRNVTSG